MKLFIFIIIILSFSSCAGSLNDKYPEKFYEIKIIDSCEYIYVSRRPWSSDFTLNHKGNCKFCSERAKKSLK